MSGMSRSGPALWASCAMFSTCTEWPPSLQNGAEIIISAQFWSDGGHSVHVENIAQLAHKAGLLLLFPDIFFQQDFYSKNLGKFAAASIIVTVHHVQQCFAVGRVQVDHVLRKTYNLVVKIVTQFLTVHTTRFARPDTVHIFFFKSVATRSQG